MIRASGSPILREVLLNAEILLAQFFLRLVAAFFFEIFAVIHAELKLYLRLAFVDFVRLVRDLNLV